MIPIAKPLLGDEEKQAVLEVLNSGMLAQGSRVKAFEKAFVNAIEKGEPSPVSGEDGLVVLHLALLLLQSGLDHQVKEITYENCFIS